MASMDCFTSMKRNERYSGPSQRRTVAELLSRAERVDAPQINLFAMAARIIAREANRDAVTNRGSDSWWESHCGTQACSKFAIARTHSPARVTRALPSRYLNDYCKETSSIRKVVDNETSVVHRNCSRIVCPR